MNGIWWRNDFDVMRIKDRAHGEIWFNKKDPLQHLIAAVIGSRDFKRLYAIAQSGLAQWANPTINHTRGEHSIGTCYVTMQFVRVLEAQLNSKSPNKKTPLCRSAFDLAEEKLGMRPEQARMRAAAAIMYGLLHDLGHIGYSHCTEDALYAIGCKLSHEKRTAFLLANSDSIVAIFQSFEQKNPLFSGLHKQLLRFAAEEDLDPVFGHLVSRKDGTDHLDFALRDKIVQKPAMGGALVPGDYFSIQTLADNLCLLGIGTLGKWQTTPLLSYRNTPQTLAALEQFFDNYRDTHWHTKDADKLFILGLFKNLIMRMDQAILGGEIKPTDPLHENAFQQLIENKDETSIKILRKINNKEIDKWINELATPAYKREYDEGSHLAHCVTLARKLHSYCVGDWNHATGDLATSLAGEKTIYSPIGDLRKLTADNQADFVLIFDEKARTVADITKYASIPDIMRRGHMPVPCVRPVGEELFKHLIGSRLDGRTADRAAL